MNNRDIFTIDPSTRKLVNQGVATVNDDTSEDALKVLDYELRTFVCSGQYQKGMEHLLETYLKNIDQPQQPAAWISGFYGSGKSHLVKMLRALWVDMPLNNGTSARNIANLPESVADLFKELTTQAKRHGGLHAASGTLGAGASGSVRLALLSIIFKSVGLPEQYPIARFVMRLKKEGILEQVKNVVEAKGYDWTIELDNFHVAEGIPTALVEVKPNLYSSSATCIEALNNQYPSVKDVSSDEMLKAIKEALSQDGKFPLTLIVLDEVQQYIGEDSQRSIEVQELVEACCKNIGGKLLFIGTGQTAVTGTANLKKLEGRFTIRIELSDADVEAVIREVVLAKKPNAIPEIDQAIKKNMGEISRHLSGTNIGHRQDDMAIFSQDYPILPIRRRFWESLLKVLDGTGTESQLRNQLSMVHKVIQTNLDKPIGHVIPADYLFFDSADKLVQTRVLPRKVHEKTKTWINGSENEKLIARACALVFLINKLTASNKELDIKTTVDILADLMVEDLSQGSSTLRNKLPDLLCKCELLMQVGDEYRIQTEESSAWNDEFLSLRSQLANEPHRIEIERDNRIRNKINDLLKKVSLNQGKAKIPREIKPFFDAKPPSDIEKNVSVWVRDGWSGEENSMLIDARQAGNQSATIFVFIPKRSADDLRHHLIAYKAASTTLERRGVPNNPEGSEARAAMETIKRNAEAKVSELLDEAFNYARVFQGGGSEVQGSDLLKALIEAAENALQRLYPQFGTADHAEWEKVYTYAKKGAPDALKAIGYEGSPSNNNVCKAILSYIAAGKKGMEIRNHFESAPYGWSKDAIHGALQVLLVARFIQAREERGQTIDPSSLDRTAIGKTLFKLESATLFTEQRIQIRKLMQKMGIRFQQGEESLVVPNFLAMVTKLADNAGGNAPMPERPDISLLEEIRLAAAGNEQLLAIFNRREELTAAIETWEQQVKKIAERLPAWEKLQGLLKFANGIEVAKNMQLQAETIETQRFLLNDPNPIQPLLKSIEDALRKELDTQHKKYACELDRRLQELEQDVYWKQLPDEKRMAIQLECDMNPISEISLGTHQQLLAALTQYPLSTWKDRLDALPGRFANARALAAQFLAPKTQTVELPRRTLTTAEEVHDWMNKVNELLKNAVAKGPVVVQ